MSVIHVFENGQATNRAALWLRQLVFDELGCSAGVRGRGAHGVTSVCLWLMHAVEGVLPFDTHAVSAGEIRSEISDCRLQLGGQGGRTCAV